MPDWDYASSGFYFITICTNGRICCLGDILVEDGGEPSVVLSDIGKIARDYWMEIPKHFSDVSSDEWIIMPNHMHGIIVIRDDNAITNGRDAINRVSTEWNGHVGGITGKYNPMLRVTLGTFDRENPGGLWM